MKGDILFRSNNGSIDTLKLINSYNILENRSIKSYANYVECNHSIGFDYELNNNGGTLNLLLQKDVNGEYLFSINGFCISRDIIIKKIRKDTIYFIDIKKCDKSKFNKIALKNFKIEYFVTTDKAIWKPFQFIPR
ncbi:hypothetical protein V8245_04875 [Flavobacterium columnare]|uniref:hypothetical protein n=1 Tax=Flavobacterium columnare TaxID=996 RepID=UPI002D2069CF|nr:hypothetical protein [Flavobacterium columnare]MEB3801686.1 hypothetical protein [Flavobacterium columnare]